MELTAAAGIIADDLAVSAEGIFVGDQALDTDRTAGVELAGADPYLGAEAVAEAVGSGWNGCGNTCRIDHLEKRSAAASSLVRMESVWWEP